jgi:hypothetical protein
VTDEVIVQHLTCALRYSRFRLAACLLQELSRSKINPDVDAILDSLPSSLFGIYSRFLRPIHETDLSYVARILSWILFSAAPLSLPELDDALAFNFSNPLRYIYDPTQRCGYAVGVCRLLEGLIIVNTMDSFNARSLQVVGLAHASVADYIVSDEFPQQYKYDLKRGPSHTSLAQTCVDYLLYFVDHPASPTTLPNYPLAVYAARYWGYHLLSCDRQPALLASVIKLLENESRQSVTLISLSAEYLYDRRSPLAMCSQVGYTEGVQFLLSNGAATRPHHDSALRAASRNGHTNIVRLLLDNLPEKNDNFSSSRTDTQMPESIRKQGLSQNLLWTPLGKSVH